MSSRGWDSNSIKTLRKLWVEGYSSAYIADQLDKKPSAIRQYVYKNRHELGLEARDARDVRPYESVSEFEREWLGCVPYKHWTITKPWELNCG